MNTVTRNLICTLVKEFSSPNTASSLAQQLQMSRWGVWKIIKKLEKEELILLQATGKGKTSTQTIHLNWKNTLTEKTLTLALAQQAETYRRWKFVFANLDQVADFVILFGSILHSPKTAEDIDILTVAKETTLLKINTQLNIIQKTQGKKIHAHNFTSKEFRQELQKPNKVFLDALRRGVVLFGQEKFSKFMREL